MAGRCVVTWPSSRSHAKWFDLFPATGRRSQSKAGSVASDIRKSSLSALLLRRSPRFEHSHRKDTDIGRPPRRKKSGLSLHPQCVGVVVRVGQASAPLKPRHHVARKRRGDGFDFTSCHLLALSEIHTFPLARTRIRESGAALGLRSGRSNDCCRPTQLAVAEPSATFGSSSPCSRRSIRPRSTRLTGEAGPRNYWAHVHRTQRVRNRWYLT